MTHGGWPGMDVRDRVEQIYEAERASIYSYLLYLGLGPHEAQDITQESFLRLYLAMGKSEPIENPRAWLFRVAHNFALKRHAKEKSFVELDTESAPPHSDPDPERAYLDEERRKLLDRAIHDLSPQQRNCLHLRAEGLRYREIADVIGISTSTVGEFLRRAVARLKETVHES